MPLYDALYDHRIAHVLVRHEAAAVFAASGFARSTGRPGVCIATSGPGATNLITGIVDAMMDNVPLVALTGQVRSTVMGTDAFQEVDVAAITHQVTKRNIVVRSIEQIEPALRAAFRLGHERSPGAGPGRSSDRRVARVRRRAAQTRSPAERPCANGRAPMPGRSMPRLPRSRARSGRCSLWAAARAGPARRRSFAPLRRTSARRSRRPCTALDALTQATRHLSACLECTDGSARTLRCPRPM